MKKLHWLIIKSFIGPFLATFAIAMAFLVMQFLWKYIDDLMGKGLGTDVILELLLYASADLIPMAVPLAILLSSIMVFGKFGELSELTSMKSAGMSLFKIFRPLTVMVIGLSISAFFYSNYTWPTAHFKMRVLISDIANQKTSLSFKEGEYYNEIPDHSIYIGKKFDDSHFGDVFISDLKVGQSYKWREIYAEKAGIKKSEDGTTLLINLYNGFSDEELMPNPSQGQQNGFRHMDFEKLALTMDLSSFTLDRTETDNYQESILYKTLQQMNRDVDSLYKVKDTYINQTKNVLKQKLFVFRDTVHNDVSKVELISADLDNYEYSKRAGVISNAKRMVSQSIIDIDNRLKTDMEHTNNMLLHVHIARNRVFTLSVAILVLFFIGAPLGAISKKGGLGYPVVFAIIFFILYYMLSITGEKLSRQGVMSPYLGMWLSTMVLAPIAIFLSYKANNDSALFDLDFYKRLFSRKKK